MVVDACVGGGCPVGWSGVCCGEGGVRTCCVCVCSVLCVCVVYCVCVECIVCGVWVWCVCVVCVV